MGKATSGLPEKRPGRVSPWSLLAAFFRLTAEPKNVDAMAPDQIVRYWTDVQKQTLRIWAAGAFAVILFLGLKAAAPDEAVVRLITTLLPTAAEDWLLDVIREIPPATGVKGVSGAAGKGYGTKVSIQLYFLLLLFVMFFMIFTWADPLNNRDYLRYLSRIRSNRDLALTDRARWLPELIYYAREILPSSRITLAAADFGCPACFKKTYCPNSLTPESRSAVERWRAMQTLISAPLMNKHLKALQICRLLFYTRYGIAISVVGLALAYGVFRLTETVFWSTPNFAPALLVYLALLMLASFIIRFFNDAMNPHRNGAWGELRDSVNDIVGSAAWKTAYVQAVCRHEGKVYEFERDWPASGPGMPVAARAPGYGAVALCEYLDAVVIKKLARQLSADTSVKEGSGWLLANILIAMEQYFMSKHKGQVTVAARVFAEDEGHLVQLGTRGDEDEPCKVSIGNQDVTISKCFSSRAPVWYRPDGGLGCVFKFDVKSAVTYPLLMPEDVALAARQGGYSVADIIGVVLVAADHDSVFSPRDEAELCGAIRFFSTRLIFEMVSAATASKRGVQ
jgi:hypothetical protein